MLLSQEHSRRDESFVGNVTHKFVCWGSDLQKRILLMWWGDFFFWGALEQYGLRSTICDNTLLGEGRGRSAWCFLRNQLNCSAFFRTFSISSVWKRLFGESRNSPGSLMDIHVYTSWLIRHGNKWTKSQFNIFGPGDPGSDIVVCFDTWNRLACPRPHSPGHTGSAKMIFCKLTQLLMLLAERSIHTGKFQGLVSMLGQWSWQLHCRRGLEGL